MTDIDEARRRHQRLGELFKEARQLAAEQRVAFLESNCEDAELRAEVLALLDTDAGTIDTGGIHEAIGRAAAEVLGATGEAGGDGNGAERKAPGAEIGPYRLIRVLGEGGFGIVYEAEQTEPVRRHVALKVIKPGMDSAGVIARFTAERQALAMMDHPGVAKVFDGGATAEGLPYFVMERIDGEAITDYADSHRLDVRQRISLFVRVCEAVQHAHTKGVIHRDLKPTNLLVEEQDGRSLPKVIDFGIAKALDQPLTEATLATRQGQLVGSIEFMSPEQIEMGTGGVDTRSDIYSLGVVLYELLCGLCPFEVGALREMGQSGIQRTIVEVNPPRPSARLAALASSEGAATAVRHAKARKTDPGKLSVMLRRDLDWIVMRCLEKDPERRYETANALAMELRRFLNDEPVLAGPPGIAYRLGKFMRRNRTGVAAGLVAVSALVVASVVSIAFAVKADKAAAAAETAHQEADRRARELQQVADFQAEQLGNIDPTTMGVRLRQNILDAVPAERQKIMEAELAGVTFTDIARTALQENIFDDSIEAVDGLFIDQPLVHAQLLQSIADVMLKLGLLDTATDPQTRALAIRQAQLGELDPVALASVNSMGELLHLQGKFDEAETYFRQALQTLRGTLGDDHPDTLRSIANLGALTRAQGKLEESEALLIEALAGRRRVLGEEHPNTLVSINNLGMILRQRGRLDEARVLYEEALAARRRVLGDEHPDTLTSLNNLGALLWAMGEPESAEPYLREALETRRRVLGLDHPASLSSTSNLGVLLLTLGRSDEAEQYHRDALEGRQRLLGRDHPSTLSSLYNLGALLKSRGRLEEAEPILLDSRERITAVFGPDHARTLYAITFLGDLYRLRGDFSQAIEILAAIEQPARERFKDGNAYRLGSILLYLGQSRVGLGFNQERFEAAQANLVEAHEIYLNLRGKDNKNTVECEQALAELYTAWNHARPGEGYDGQAATWAAL